MTDSRKSYVIPFVAGIAVALAAGSFVYFNRSHFAHWQLSNEQDHMWEVILKGVAGYLAISGALIAALKYLDDKLHSTEIARREARRDFSIKQQELYFRLLRATSTIANENVGSPERIVSEKDFWRLYWGEIVLVEDHSVAVAVGAFSDALWDDPTNSTQLLNMSMDVARRCRDSLGETWKIDQNELPPSVNRISRARTI